MSTCHSEQSRLCSRRFWTVRMRTVSRFVSTAMALMLFVQAGQAQVLKPRPISVEAYGESYTAVASVDDGGMSEKIWSMNLVEIDRLDVQSPQRCFHC